MFTETVLGILARLEIGRDELLGPSSAERPLKTMKTKQKDMFMFVCFLFSVEIC